MKRKVALGPGAASLILIVVVLSLCMMAMLTQIGARNDYNLCKRSAEMVQPGANRNWLSWMPCWLKRRRKPGATWKPTWRRSKSFFRKA